MSKARMIWTVAVLVAILGNAIMLWRPQIVRVFTAYCLSMAKSLYQ